MNLQKNKKKSEKQPVNTKKGAKMRKNSFFEEKSQIVCLELKNYITFASLFAAVA